MYSTNTKIVCVAVLLVVLAALIFTAANIGMPSVGSNEQGQGYQMIYSVADEEIATVHVLNETSEYTVERCEDILKRADGREVIDVVYRVLGNHDMELSQDTVKELLNDFYEFHILEVASETSEAKDLKKYGFSESSPTVSINKKDGTSTVFMLGGISKNEKIRYVRKTDDSKIYGMLKVKEKSFLNELEYYRQRRIGTLDAYTLLSFSVTDKNERIMGIRYKNENDREVVTTDTITYVMILPYNGAVNIDRFGELMSVFNEVYAVDFVEDEPKNLAKYGLDDANSLRVVIQDVEKNRHELVFGKADEAGNIYTMYGGKNIVFTTEPKMYNAVKDINPAEFIDKYTNIYNMDDVKNVTVTETETGKVYSLDIDKNGDIKYKINGKEAHNRGFEAVYQGIINIKIDGTAETEKKEKQILEITFKFNNGSEKTSYFYEYDAKHFGAVTTDDEYGLVSKYVINNLLEVLELFDKKPHLEP